MKWAEEKMEEMADVTLAKVAISGPTLASLMQRIFSSLEDVDGLLFGHISRSSSPTLADDPSVASSRSESQSSDPQFTATVTSFLCPGPSILSFYDPQGNIRPNLPNLISHSTIRSPLLGWFSARRRTPIRPSMREFSVSHSLSSVFPSPTPPSFADAEVTLSPCVFLLFSTPPQGQLIHSHEYRAYQYRSSSLCMEPRSLNIVNIGPAFRGHYGSFAPTNSTFFPSVPFKDINTEPARSMRTLKEDDRGQKEVDHFAEGFRFQDLKHLAGVDASSYTAKLEDLYEKMISRVQVLAKEVEISNAEVQFQENRNRQMRSRIASSKQEQPTWN